jgi:L-ascorbate metabolism protein UlaG (beta-lactamase superfamily)
MPTLGRLWSKFRPRFVTPLGNDTILTSGLLGDALSSPPSGLRIDAVDWGQTTELLNGVKLHTVPTLHWSARGMRDRRHALWASFVLETPAHRLYCVGDSGFGDGATFRATREKFGAVDLALLPIGAYEPRWFMKGQHMNPADAVAAFELLGAKRALGHHWGTFKLTNEGVEHPARDLAKALDEKGIAPESFVAVRPGAVIDLA